MLLFSLSSEARRSPSFVNHDVSTEFIVAIELLGTILLPVATILLGIMLAQLPFIDFSTVRFIDMIPLIILSISFLLPVILVMITTRKVSYIGWMMIFLFALPIWQLILPLWAFWRRSNRGDACIIQEADRWFNFLLFHTSPSQTLMISRGG